MSAKRTSGNYPKRQATISLFLPYSADRADPALVAKHEALGSLPKGTLGRGYFEIYKTNGYAFPGDPKGVNSAFARPHDSTHVISGYDTTPLGEILVSTFAAGMHPKLRWKGASCRSFSAGI
jgi:ubiquinone biosynthesis protein Coq4